METVLPADYFTIAEIFRKVDCRPEKLSAGYPELNAGLLESFIRHKDNLLHYVKAGNGKQPLLVFHGFGQDHTLYVPLLRSLSKKYTLYVIDLFFHGKSEWHEGERPLQKKAWEQMIQVLLRENRIASFSIMGYSLGGKFALATLESFPKQVQELFLIAPDGIKTSFWYSLATYPPILRKFFKSMILRHDRFLWVAGKLNKSGLIDRGVVRFADYQMNTESKRKRVYYSWVVFRRLTFDLKSIAELINTNNIRLTMVVGKHDKVIRPENMHRFLKHVRDYNLEVVESGHTGLMQECLYLLAD